MDRRADIWAFGCVLYEMLTGNQAFDAVAAPSVAAGVRQAVDLARLPPETPAAIRRLLTRCLDEDRTNRLDHVAIARFQIEEVLSAPAEYHTTSPARRQFLLRLAWGLSLPAVAAATWRAARGRPEGGRMTRLLTTVAPADQMGGDDGRPRRTALALSPDGRALVFSGEQDGRRRLYLRRFESDEAVPIAGTEGATNPLFSPDGQWIGFWADGQIRKVPRGGGPPARVADVENMFGASWGDDDRIVFARITGGLLEVPAGGGTVRALTAIDRASGALSHRLPHALPGGDAVLYTVTKHRFPLGSDADRGASRAVPGTFRDRPAAEVLRRHARRPAVLLHPGARARAGRGHHDSRRRALVRGSRAPRARPVRHVPSRLRDVRFRRLVTSGGVRRSNP